MLNSSGCVVPWIMSNEKICTEEGVFKTGKMSYLGAMKFSITDAINTTYWIAWNRVTNNFNDCYETCRDLKVIVGGRNMKKVV